MSQCRIVVLLVVLYTFSCVTHRLFDHFEKLSNFKLVALSSMFYSSEPYDLDG